MHNYTWAAVTWAMGETDSPACDPPATGARDMKEAEPPCRPDRRLGARRRCAEGRARGCEGGGGSAATMWEPAGVPQQGGGPVA